MSLSPSHLAAIQQAGQALHKAAQLTADSVRSQAQTVVAMVASQPFQNDSEQAFAQFRVLAQLSQDLQAMELQLRGLYATAEELSNPALDVIGDQHRLPTHVTDKSSAEDAIIKPARSSAPSRKSAKRRVSAKGS